MPLVLKRTYSMYSTIFAVALAGLTSASPLIKRQSEALSAYAVVTGDGIDGLFNFTEVPGTPRRTVGNRSDSSEQVKALK